MDTPKQPIKDNNTLVKRKWTKNRGRIEAGASCKEGIEMYVCERPGWIESNTGCRDQYNSYIYIYRKWNTVDDLGEIQMYEMYVCERPGWIKSNGQAVFVPPRWHIVTRSAPAIVRPAWIQQTLWALNRLYCPLLGPDGEESSFFAWLVTKKWIWKM